MYHCYTFHLKLPLTISACAWCSHSNSTDSHREPSASAAPFAVGPGTRNSIDPEQSRARAPGGSWILYSTISAHNVPQRNNLCLYSHVRADRRSFPLNCITVKIPVPWCIVHYGENAAFSVKVKEFPQTEGDIDSSWAAVTPVLSGRSSVSPGGSGAAGRLARYRRRSLWPRAVRRSHGALAAAGTENGFTR